ncbi:MAG: hypothetical protein LBT40_02975 [Deltaproteobacteria bacterium]|nr:hypothetical protein [Deltaproteobacteria bacterium]
MAEPSLYDFMLPILRQASWTAEVSPRTLEEPVLRIMGLPESFRRERLPSSSFTLLASKLHWGCHLLAAVGFLSPVPGGSYAITPKGRTLLGTGISRMDAEFLAMLPGFREAVESLQARRAPSGQPESARQGESAGNDASPERPVEAAGTPLPGEPPETERPSEASGEGARPVQAPGAPLPGEPPDNEKPREAAGEERPAEAPGTLQPGEPPESESPREAAGEERPGEAPGAPLPGEPPESERTREVAGEAAKSPEAPRMPLPGEPDEASKTAKPERAPVNEETAEADKPLEAEGTPLPAGAAGERSPGMAQVTGRPAKGAGAARTAGSGPRGRPRRSTGKPPSLDDIAPAELLLPILQVTEKLGAATRESVVAPALKLVSAARERLGSFMPQLPPETLAGRFGSAFRCLLAAGLLQGQDRLSFRLSGEGAGLLKRRPDSLDFSDLEAYPAYRAAAIVADERKRLQLAAMELRAEALEETVGLILRMSPDKFGRLAEDVFRAMKDTGDAGGPFAVLDPPGAPDAIARLDALAAGQDGGGEPTVFVRGGLPEDALAILDGMAEDAVVVDERALAGLMLWHGVGTRRKVSIKIKEADLEAFDALLS